MAFKVGDRVRITEDRAYAANVSFGDTGRVETVRGDTYQVVMDNHRGTFNSYIFNADVLEPIPANDPQTYTTSDDQAPAFTPEQEARLVDVVSRIAREHGACSVAADALKELGVTTLHEVRTVSLNLTLEVPIRNTDGGRVQLPSKIPNSYLASSLPPGALNAFVDALISNGGYSGNIQRDGDVRLSSRSIAEPAKETKSQAGEWLPLTREVSRRGLEVRVSVDNPTNCGGAVAHGVSRGDIGILENDRADRDGDLLVTLANGSIGKDRYINAEHLEYHAS